MAGRTATLLYGAAAYATFLLSLLYAVGFMGNFIVPKSVDFPATSSDAMSWAIDLALLGAFAMQHSGMARPSFKRWWTRFVPQPIERSTYVLISSLLLFLLFWLWRPLNAEVWRVQNAVVVGMISMLFVLGWLFVVASSFMIDHFELFGLRQVWCHYAGRGYSPLPFRTPLAYRYVRHPIMLGFIIAFWATPNMTVGHLLFAAVTTAYILAAVSLEERDLVAFYGETYRAYQKRTGSLLPWPTKRRESPK